jgi:hypothetical protein
MAIKKTHRPVLVTTAHRGVFFGYMDGESGNRVKLKSARLCVSWTADLRGFMGLAATGPSKGCRIGPRADIELFDVTSVVAVSPEAVAKWEEGPWA